MKNKKMIFIAFLVLLFVIIGELIVYSNYSSFSGRKKHITYITFGDSDNNWADLKSGAETALKNDNVEVDFVSSQIEDGVEGQIALIEGELKTNADAIVISPIDSSEMDMYLDSIKSNKKIVVLRYRDSLLLPSNSEIFPNDKAIGKSIGQRVADDGLESVLLVSYGNSATNKSRYESVTAVLDNNDVKYSYFCAEDYSYEYSQFKKEMNSFGAQGVVALDDISLDYVGRMSQSKEISSLVYGIGNTKDDIYWLDYGVINYLIFVDEFSLGYLSAEIATDKSVSSSKRNQVLKFYEVDKENMYDDELSKVLFPFDN